MKTDNGEWAWDETGAHRTPFGETCEKIRAVERKTGVKVKIRRIRKGDANCRHPGCWGIRGVGIPYCGSHWAEHNAR